MCRERQYWLWCGYVRTKKKKEMDAAFEFSSCFPTCAYALHLPDESRSTSNLFVTLIRSPHYLRRDLQLVGSFSVPFFKVCTNRIRRRLSRSSEESLWFVC